MNKILTNENLINELIKFGYLKTESIINAFKEIKRENFVSDEYKKIAYNNMPLPIGFRQTISQPLVVAFMLELLNIKPEDKILEIGTGSGWQTALMGRIIQNQSSDGKAKGKIISIEIIDELYKFAKKNINKYKFIQNKTVSLVLSDGSKGYSQEAPFDKIISTASAEKIPSEWKDQLKISGIIIAPVKNSILKITKTGKNEYETKEYYGFSFVPLVLKNKSK